MSSGIEADSILGPSGYQRATAVQGVGEEEVAAETGGLC